MRRLSELSMPPPSVENFVAGVVERCGHIIEASTEKVKALLASERNMRVMNHFRTRSWSWLLTPSHCTLPWPSAVQLRTSASR